MFRFHKGLDVITLFHKPSLPASMKVHALLKQASAVASTTATEDQASDHSHQTHPKRPEFELDVQESAPTEDQVRSIIEYIGAPRAGEVIRGASNAADALKKLKASQDSFQYPLVVDWENGRAVPGDKESEILKLLDSLPKNK